MPPDADGYDLEPLPADAGGSPQPRVEAIAAADAVCLVCGYSLRGLVASGLCPECGTPIGRSLGGNLLRYSDRSYVAWLHRGVIVILGAVAAQLVVGIAQFLAFASFLAPGTIITSRPAAVSRSLDLSFLYIDAALSLVLLYGWWIFSSPDPAFLGVDRGVTARRIVRVAVVAGAASTALVAAHGTAYNLSPGTWTTTILVDLAAFAVMFFASMLYVQRLAPRLPDEHVAKRARMLMWLGPVVYLFGCGIGALVALVFYWNMFNWVRLDIKRIQEAS